MSSRNASNAEVDQIIALQNDLDTTLTAYEAARAALGDCELLLDQARASFELGDSRLRDFVYDPTTARFWFDDDPQPYYVRARDLIARLADCLGPAEEPGEPAAEPAGEPVVTTAAAAAFPWRAVGGLALIALAAYGFWRMR